MFWCKAVETHTAVAHILPAESGVRVPGSAVLSHPCFQSSVWAGPLSPHQQVPSSLLQVQTRYVAVVNLLMWTTNGGLDASISVRSLILLN